MIKEEEHSEYRKYALKFFEIHAAQRMLAFRFFLIVALAIGWVILEHQENGGWVFPYAGIALSCFALIFWGLDWRTMQLVKNSEEALKYLESSLCEPNREPPRIAIVSSDDYWKERSGIGFISYKNCFRVVFALSFIAGLIPPTSVWICGF